METERCLILYNHYFSRGGGLRESQGSGWELHNSPEEARRRKAEMLAENEHTAYKTEDHVILRVTEIVG